MPLSYLDVETCNIWKHLDDPSDARNHELCCLQKKCLCVLRERSTQDLVSGCRVVNSGVSQRSAIACALSNTGNFQFGCCNWLGASSENVSSCVGAFHGAESPLAILYIGRSHYDIGSIQSHCLFVLDEAQVCLPLLAD